jgi:hypothetical protein
VHATSIRSTTHQHICVSLQLRQLLHPHVQQHIKTNAYSTSMGIKSTHEHQHQAGQKRARRWVDHKHADTQAARMHCCMNRSKCQLVAPHDVCSLVYTLIKPK